MWPIINGDEPIFYIHYDGSDYEMIDGMTWQFASAMVPLQVSGDYPEWNYKFTGTVESASGCISSFFDVFMEFNTVPVPTITGNDPVCAGSVATYTTEPGMNGYVWNIVGGTGTSATNSITVTWGSSLPDPSASTTPIPTAPCTAAAPTVKSIVINALPVVSDVTLLADVGTSPSAWSAAGERNLQQL
ncbi:MAG: hypothetical protein MZV63_56135 [Marinilabiliales bacterium]|nr:hypothetical protein [Marinilabiliales bacterium]